MRFIKFIEPTWKCTVKDRSGRELGPWYYAGASKQEIEELLAAKGYQPVSIERYELSEWKKRVKAEAALANKAKNKDYEYNSSFWAEIKQFLFLLTNDRCGYCETPTRVAGPGEVEHYRPKRGPSEDPKHPGYYWLAYDVDNYVPCCTNCNSIRGKRSRFPLAPRSPRARTPAQLAKEKPLLLHPFKDKPHEHLKFIGNNDRLRFGELEGTTTKGKTSVKVYDLNRNELVEARKLAYDAIKQRLNFATSDEATRVDILAKFKSGDLDYYILTGPAVRDWFKERELYEAAQIEASKLRLKAIENERNMLGV